ncbi:hypothetical protein [Cellulophaga tyrosinoxydans]|uniref:PQQ-like domain-containing protein n=1 Tax=Cellulophaga tyrosinoxydans TaxID=504486 RepID=A0A1W1YPR0_9FLAO|nr:hypothetical protein [Cellulophaga tyrosinoxydans]SMC38200.1 hypothetical protein SAMN05660703_0732 [Cellulophaga tyrosinoxydans]
MKFLNKIEKVNKYILNRYVGYLSNGFFYLNEDKYVYPSSNIYSISSNVFSSKDFYLNKNKKLEYLNKMKGKYFSGIHYNNILLYTDSDNFYLFDYKTNNTLFSSFFYEDRSIHLILKNIYLCYGDNFISGHNLNTGEELWNTDWKVIINDTTAYLLTNKLLVVNTLLFLSFANKDQNPIGSIVINTITGELVQKLPLLKGFLYNNNDTSIVATSGIFNNTQTLSIYNINANTGKQIVLNTIFHKPNWSIKHESSVIHNNKLYLAIQQGATFIASVLAILDLETYQILDTHEFLKDDNKESNPDNWLHIEKIKVNDFMIAVLTAGGTLHVFEKEESI